jgi:predicted transcriptional regulator
MNATAQQQAPADKQQTKKEAISNIIKLVRGLRQRGVARAEAIKQVDEALRAATPPGQKRMPGEAEFIVAKAYDTRFRTAEQAIADPDPEPVIEGLVWADSISVLASESGGGKTFVLLHAGACVASGNDFFSRKVKVGSVAYVYFEGNINKRLEALRQVGYDLSNLYTLRARDPISPRVDRDGTEKLSMGEAWLSEEIAKLRDQLAAEGRPPLVLLIIDTVRASLVGSEDSSETISAYLRVIRRLLDLVPGLGSILAHHTGWQDGDGRNRPKTERERGSSAFRGNVDGTLFLKVTGEEHDEDGRPRAYLELRTLKDREDERARPLRLVRQQVDLPQREALKSRTSCVIELDARRWGDVEEAEREARASEMEEENAKVDLLVLKTIRDHKVTSQGRLRQMLGRKTDAVAGSLSRLMLSGLVKADKKQRDPFTLTPEGAAQLGSRA